MIMPGRSPNDPKRLKRAQADKLSRIALDGRRRPATRQWAMRMLTDAGESLEPNPAPKPKRSAKTASKTAVPR